MPQQMTWNKGSTILNRFSYTYNADGTMQSKTDLAWTDQNNNPVKSTYGYDDLGREQEDSRGTVGIVDGQEGDPQSVYLAVEDDRWENDSVGTKHTDRYTLSGGTPHQTRDPDGNDQQLTYGAFADASLRFDAWGRVVQVNATVSARPSSGPIALQYDASGREITSTDRLSTTHSYYDGQRLVQTNAGADSDVVWSPDGQVIRQGGDYLLTDAEGSVTALADAGGVVTARFVYDADGQVFQLDSNHQPETADGRAPGATDSDLTFFYHQRRLQPLFYAWHHNGQWDTGGGLSMDASGTWYDTFNGDRVTPMPQEVPSQSPYDPHKEAYDPSSEAWYMHALAFPGAVATMGLSDTKGFMDVADIALPVLQAAAVVGSFFPATAPVALPLSIALGGASQYAAGDSWTEIGKSVAWNVALTYGPLAILKAAPYVEALINGELAASALATEGGASAAAEATFGNCFTSGTPVLAGSGKEEPIQDVPVGSRVATDDGVANSADGKTSAADPNQTEVDPKTWRLVSLTVDAKTADGGDDLMEVRELMPLSELRREHAKAGRSIPVPLDLGDIFEYGATARVESIAACPPIQAGPGRVVLTTITHLNDYVFHLTLQDASGNTETLGVTGFHKLFAEDRGWTSVASLHIGEQMRGDHGDLTVVSLTRDPGVQRVYNLTVEADHSYYVGDLQALSHNINDCNFVPLEDLTVNGRSVGAAAERVSSEFQTLRATARFLKSEGLDASLRREMIEAGFSGTIGADTPATMARFEHLFPETVQAGKAFSGKLGNIPTRVATVMEAQAMERAGLTPSFEYWTGRNAIDLVGLDAARQPVNPAIEFVKWNRLWKQEIPRAFQITFDTGLPVRFVVTGGLK